MLGFEITAGIALARCFVVRFGTLAIAINDALAKPNRVFAGQ